MAGILISTLRQWEIQSSFKDKEIHLTKQPARGCITFSFLISVALAATTAGYRPTTSAAETLQKVPAPGSPHAGLEALSALASLLI